MGKNIIVLCDGTSNQISQDRTNILRLFGTLEKSTEQIVYYDPGVGTFGAADSPSRYWRKSAEIWGLATGWGLDANVKEAYHFIVENYDHGQKDNGGERDSDKIFIYGFSRGAYTARVLAGFIHAVGVLHPHQMNLLDYAYSAFKGISEQNAEEDNEGAGAFAEIRLYERTLRPIRPVIALLGLFDTVASVIESGRNGIRLRSHAFTSKNRSVAAVRHALAIDERRTMFQPQFWWLGQKHRPKYWDQNFEIDQDAKEVWFSGSHGDVGGGLPESRSQLAKVPLKWMIDESKPLGVKFKTRTVNTIVLGKNDDKYVKPDSTAQPDNSMVKFWPAVEYLPRRNSIYVRTNRRVIAGLFIPRKEPRIVPSGSAIHQSIFENQEATGPKPNIPTDHTVVPTEDQLATTKRKRR